MNRYTLAACRSAAVCALLSLSTSFAFAAVTEPDPAVADVQHQWEVIQYQVPAPDRAARFQALASTAHQLTQTRANQAGPHVWEGIVLSSWAHAKGGLGALDIAKQAKAEFETAISIDPRALHGAAVNSLAVLYAKVPGWPLGFGDKTKAEALFHQALAIDPASIDTNYFYADFLADTDRKAQAMPYLQQALKAPPRPGREIADKGRREDIAELMAQISR